MNTLRDDELYSFTRAGLTGRIYGDLFQVAQGDDQTGTIGLDLDVQVRAPLPRFRRMRLLVNVKRLAVAEYIVCSLMPTCEAVVWPVMTKCLVRYGVVAQKMYADWTALEPGNRREKDTLLKAFELVLQYQKPELLFGMKIDLAQEAQRIVRETAEYA